MSSRNCSLPASSTKAVWYIRWTGIWFSKSICFSSPPSICLMLSAV